MKNGKATLKDVANYANVSTATVSYVLNYSTKQKISHETRLKIFEAARKLNYIPNLTARSLAIKKTNLIGIIISLNENTTKSKLHYYYDLINKLQESVSKLGYDVVISITKDIKEDLDIITKRAFDTTFIIDVDKEHTHNITKQHIEPIILIDSNIDDELFFKINSNYNQAFEIATSILKDEDIYLITEANITSNLFKSKNTIINSNSIDLENFLKDKANKKFVVVGEFLGVQVERFIKSENLVVITHSENNILLKNTKKILINNKEKIQIATELIEKLITFQDIDKEKLILIEPKTIKN